MPFLTGRDRPCPPGCRLVSQWPAPLQSFCLALGVDAVYEVGLDVLGFPPTWANTARELFAVVKVVEGKEW